MEQVSAMKNYDIQRMFFIFLDSLNFTVSFVEEDDGSVTGEIRELDLFANSASKSECMMILLEDMKEYAQDFYREFDLWSSAPNRRKHIPYVLKILSASDDKLLEAMRCQAGEI